MVNAYEAHCMRGARANPFRFLSVGLLLLVAAEPTSRPSSQSPWKLREGASSVLQSVIDRQKELRPAEVGRLEVAIKAAQQAASDAKGKERTSANTKVQTLRKHLADVRSGRVVAVDAPMVHPSEVRVGWAGAGLDSRVTCRVIQVVDEENALIKIVYLAASGSIERPRIVEKSVPFWLSGVPTNGWTDNAVVELPGLIMATGTYQYPAPNGVDRTVTELKPFSYADFVRTDR